MISGSQWENENTTAFVISEDEALQAILKSGNDDLLQDFSPKEREKLDSQEVER